MSENHRCKGVGTPNVFPLLIHYRREEGGTQTECCLNFLKKFFHVRRSKIIDLILSDGILAVCLKQTKTAQAEPYATNNKSYILLCSAENEIKRIDRTL